MDVWVADSVSTINGQDPTNDATRVNNPYLVPATATSFLRAQFQTLGPGHQCHTALLDRKEESGNRSPHRK